MKKDNPIFMPRSIDATIFGSNAEHGPDPWEDDYRNFW